MQIIQNYENFFLLIFRCNGNKTRLWVGLFFFTTLIDCKKSKFLGFEAPKNKSDYSIHVKVCLYLYRQSVRKEIFDLTSKQKDLQNIVFRFITLLFKYISLLLESIF